MPFVGRVSTLRQREKHLARHEASTSRSVFLSPSDFRYWVIDRNTGHGVVVCIRNSKSAVSSRCKRPPGPQGTLTHGKADYEKHTNTS